MFKKGSFKKGDVVTWVGDRIGEDIKGKGFDVLVTEDVEGGCQRFSEVLFKGIVVRADEDADWVVGSTGGDEECWVVSSFKLLQQDGELKEEKKMKDVEQYIKPFNRFEMANGKRGVFLDFEGEVCAVYFEANVRATYHSGVLSNILEGDTHYRAVKIWEKERGGADITTNFNYDVTPIWQEESAQECARRKQIEQLEETIKKAQQQIAELKGGCNASLIH